ncbi:MAG: nitroreductase family protein [Clostridia bacterium]|nr:nitroreductase family protein [Clostridia bacterium]
MKEIMNRRSVRQYTDHQITPEEETSLLRAAMQAPSAGNEQPWEFIVLRERENIMKLTVGNPYSKMLEHAPMAIVVCGDLSRQRFPYDFWIQDCSAAVQNILIEAVHLGLGGVWLGTYPIEERVKGIQQAFSLPENIVPLAVLAIGQPAKEPEPADRFIPERIHRENW